MGFATDLKKAILKMAVSGKLTKQLKSDGNAEDLFIEIQKNKEKLIKDKKIKKGKPLKDIDDAELPFEIPKNWKWCRFSEIVNYRLGKTPPRVDNSSWGNDYKWVSIADMISYGIIEETKDGISKKGFAKHFKSIISPKGTLIMSFKLTIGRVSILGVDALHNEAIISIFPYNDEDNIIRNYLFNTLELLCDFVESNNAIKGKTLNSESISNILVPLPPLAEQRRIVEKLDKIMPEIDEIAMIEKELVRISKKYPIDLKKSILKMAVSGKLTKQLKSDGDAKDLFAGIQKTKEQLIKDKKIKKEKQLKDIDETELPFDIPKNWKWCRLGDLGKYKKGPFGSSLTKSMFVKKDKNTIKVYEQKNAINKNAFIGDYYITNNYFKDKMKSFEVKANDIIVSCAGTIGETYIMPDNCEKGIINQALMMIDLYDKRLLKYYLVYFEIMVKYNAIKESNGSAIKNIPPFDILKNYYFPLPTIAEQNRIVEKLDSIMNEIDGISNNIKNFENISK